VYIAESYSDRNKRLKLVVFQRQTRTVVVGKLTLLKKLRVRPELKTKNPKTKTKTFLSSHSPNIKIQITTEVS
jgi:hypothetical protein